MKVTPISKNFGKYKPGDVFELRDATAKILIKVKKLQAAESSMGYQTRALQAAQISIPAVEVVNDVPFGEGIELDADGVEWDAEIHASNKLKKADGTWRKRAGRVAAGESAEPEA